MRRTRERCVHGVGDTARAGGQDGTGLPGRGPSGRLGLLCLAAALLSPVILNPATAQAEQRRVGLGVYGVYGIPIIQEDVGAGPLYGIKARADLFGPIGAEVSYTSFQEGDVTFTTPAGEQTMPGGTQNVLGVNAILGGAGDSGVGFYLTGGVGSYSLTRDNRDDLTRIGFNGGLGLELRSNAGIAIDLSGRAHAVTMEDGGTRKFGAIQAGINYDFIR